MMPSVSLSNFYGIDILKSIIGSQFAKNVITLMTGSVIAQIITMGTSPILTRLFTPENFGIFALFGAFVTVINTIGSLRYERAILLPQKNESAINVLFLSSLILFIICTLTFFVVFYFKNEISNHLGNSEFSFWIQFVPIAILMTGLVNIFRYWRLRNREFKTIAFSRIFNAAVEGAMKIFVGLLIGAYSGGLIGSAILGTFVALIFLVWKPTPFNFNKYFEHVSPKTIKTMAKSYNKFPLFGSWNSLIDVFSKEFIIFLFSIYFSPAIVGFYSLSSKMIRKPIGIFSESIQKAYFQKSAYQTSNKKLLIPGLKKTIVSLIITGILPFFCLAIFGKQIFGIIFGYNWETSGIFIQIMSPWFFTMYISGPTHVIYEVCNKQNIKLYLNILNALMRVIVIICGCLITNNPIIILILFTTVNVFFDVITIWYGFSTARFFDQRVGNIMHR